MNVVARQAAPTSFQHGRVDRVVIHVERESVAGMVESYINQRAHVSTHYGVGKDGSVLQFVGDADVAWHAGNAGVNARSIGVEIEGFTASLHVPGVQLGALVELVGALCLRYQIPIDRQHVIGHDEVPDPNNPGLFGGAAHHTDPGPLFPWDEFMRRLAPPPPPPAA